MKFTEVNIRKMLHKDYAHMAKWLSTKEVLEFFGDVNAPFTIEQVKTKYEPRVNREVLVFPYIVELNETPAGFMQQYKISKEKQEEFGYPSPCSVYGIDQFIGEPELFNQGLGTIMVTNFIGYLFRTTDAEIIIVDPEVTNVRAIRCYEKCGFRKVKKVNEKTNWLMDFNSGRMKNL
ncbi:GNAT family N-acetyltransferase [Planococcus sp. N028]|uniref:GNAT family N-acetyltransferase n=2 Tax=Planococcus shixiaomingii TaxID=3058393 RepID=A0ABT8MYL4_9BACL|nr:GNAT family N-acetyltransferase [Planococcus sp. N028]